MWFLYSLILFQALIKSLIFKPTVKYMITPHVPKLQLRKLLLFFSSHIRMSGKRVNFDDKKKKSKVTFTKTKK